MTSRTLVKELKNVSPAVAPSSGKTEDKNYMVLNANSDTIKEYDLTEAAAEAEIDRLVNEEHDPDDEWWVIKVISKSEVKKKVTFNKV